MPPILVRAVAHGQQAADHIVVRPLLIADESPHETPRVETSSASLRDRAISELLAPFVEKLPPREREAMCAFRSRAEELHLLTPFWDNDLTAYRFCKACGFDSENAIAMFQQHLAWRDTVGLNIIATPDGLQPRLLNELRIDDLAQLRKIRRFTFHKTAAHGGHPMFFDLAGEMRVEPIKSVLGSLDRMVQYFIWYHECTLQYRLPAASLACGELVVSSMYVARQPRPACMLSALLQV